jgi:hypothetical protein
MLDITSLRRATIIGTLLQIAMVVAGHFDAFVAEHVFMFGGMAISALAGFLYGRGSKRGYGLSAMGGAVAGGVCALIGIALSVALGDTAAMILLFGTISSVVTGALGGMAGQAAR